MYKVLLTKNAVKQLNSLDNKTYLRIYDRISLLKTDPRPIGALKLTSSESYRIRVGNYRIIYEIEDGKLIVEIYNIAHRKDVYKNIK